MEKTFSKENCDKLNSTCVRVNNLLATRGTEDLTYGQLIALGGLIKEFMENPIVKNSGIEIE